MPKTQSTKVVKRLAKELSKMLELWGGCTCDECVAKISQRTKEFLAALTGEQP